MTIDQIARYPASQRVPEGAVSIHESCTRAYHVLERIKRMINSDYPPALLKDFLKDVDAAVASVCKQKIKDGLVCPVCKIDEGVCVCTPKFVLPSPEDDKDPEFGAGPTQQLIKAGLAGGSERDNEDSSEVRLIAKSQVPGWKSKNYEWVRFDAGTPIQGVVDRIDFLTGEIYFALLIKTGVKGDQGPSVDDKTNLDPETDSIFQAGFKAGLREGHGTINGGPCPKCHYYNCACECEPKPEQGPVLDEAGRKDRE